jgi:hypothetical protein
VVPAIAQLFSSNDRAIRRSLLEGIDSFARHFSTELVEEKIFPAIATGAALGRVKGHSRLQQPTVGGLVAVAG